ncbi:hypothetical protein OPV22_020434 [Ensete ventricosum]|uniref:Uncharacterized protein n=1 Tax=Ensete ventricosum TaxID=4639 RepID=A0AAV8QNA4_ENSVE|nr:hypothetical protein OPV22_020434 [Ensete ventricosum]
MSVVHARRLRSAAVADRHRGRVPMCPLTARPPPQSAALNGQNIPQGKERRAESCPEEAGGVSQTACALVLEDGGGGGSSGHCLSSELVVGLAILVKELEITKGALEICGASSVLPCIFDFGYPNISPLPPRRIQ